MKNETLIDLTRALVQTPSLSGQEGDIARLIEKKMLEMRFDEVAIDRYGSVVGTIHGSRKGKTVLMDGHIDTVDCSDASLWTHDPYSAEVLDGKIYGRGTSDMKGGVAAMICAAAEFAHETKKEFAGMVSVSCTVHEECFEGVSAREVSKNVKPDYVIIGEATSLTLKRAQRGRVEIVVETVGRTCHSANPEKGINAVQHMCAVINEIGKIELAEHPLLGKGLLELTDIISSPYPGASVVPGRCRTTYDRRTLPGETPELVLAPIRAAIERAKTLIPSLVASAAIVRGAEICYTGEPISADRFFPAWLLDENEALVQKALAGLSEAGINAPLTHFSFCTNGSHFCGEAGIPTIGFGPSLENLAHVIDEYIEIEQLLQACKGYCGILRQLTR